jgi:hypothetical protein
VTLRSGDDVIKSLEQDRFSDSLKRYLSRELGDDLKKKWTEGKSFINVSSVECSSLCTVSLNQVTRGLEGLGSSTEAKTLG